MAEQIGPEPERTTLDDDFLRMTQALPDTTPPVGGVVLWDETTLGRLKAYRQWSQNGQAFRQEMLQDQMQKRKDQTHIYSINYQLIQKHRVALLPQPLTLAF